MPTDFAGDNTGHLLGLLSRVAHCMENDIKIVCVFDGKPPEQKYSELRKRKETREKAE